MTKPIDPAASRLDVMKNNADSIDIHLFTNTPTLDGSTTVASFTEATFPGYAPQRSDEWDISSDAAYPGSVVLSENFRWRCHATATGQVVRGWLATITFPDHTIRLVAAHILTDPVTMEAAGAGLSLDVAMKAYEV